MARSLAGEEGSVILVTDHIQEVLPYNAALIAVGRKQRTLVLPGCGLSMNQPSSAPESQAQRRHRRNPASRSGWP
ncbi:MAG: hypothetical protein R3F31_21970 [Verrucomicrobiales bacterium]